MKHGETATNTRLSVEDLVNLYTEAMRCGFDASLLRKLPPHANARDPPAEVYPQQFLRICMAFANGSENVDVGEMRAELDKMREAAHEAWSKGGYLTLDREVRSTFLSLQMFRGMLRLLAELIAVDVQYLVSFLAWSRCGFFEIPDSLFDHVRRSLHRHHHEEVPECFDPITVKDVEQMLRAIDLIDPNSTHGIKMENAITILMHDNSHASELVDAHVRHHPGIHRSDFEETKRARHSHRRKDSTHPDGVELVGLIGRTEFAIFVDEVWKACPGGAKERVRSPLELVALFYTTFGVSSVNDVQGEDAGPAGA